MDDITTGEGVKIKYEFHQAASENAILILAHGAGAGMNHAFMQSVAALLNENGISVILFNFPYMEAGRKSPGSPKKNIETWQVVIEACSKEFKDLPVFIGGKSYGGRMASHLLAEHTFEIVNGIVYFGFPLHAPGRASKDRAAHLEQVKVPQLFLQGKKDKLANPRLITEVVHKLKRADLLLIDDADHSFHVPKKSGKTDKQVLSEICLRCKDWILSIEKQ